MRLTEKMNVRAIAVKSEMTISTPIAERSGRDRAYADEEKDGEKERNDGDRGEDDAAENSNPECQRR